MSIEYNFQTLSALLSEKKTAILNNKYSKSVPLAMYYDRQFVTQVEAIYNLLQIMDERLKMAELEKKLK